jgi:threonine synthase
MAGLQPVIFIPYGNISFGKLAQALEYGAKTIQVEANFDQILALVRQLADRLGIYLLNSINPFRIEGQKTIMAEMLDQRDWSVPDWVVLPGGNLGNISAFGKGLRELKELGLIDRLPRLAVVQAAFRAVLDLHAADRSRLNPSSTPTRPPPSRSATRFPGRKRHELDVSNAWWRRYRAEIADAKAVIGRCGIGCEPASLPRWRNS